MSLSSTQNPTGLEAALQAVGGTKKALADKLGLTKARITQWGDTVPFKWIEEVERATGVHRSVLRPDLGFAEPVKRRRKAAA